MNRHYKNEDKINKKMRGCSGKKQGITQIKTLVSSGHLGGAVS